MQGISSTGLKHYMRHLCTVADRNYINNTKPPKKAEKNVSECEDYGALLNRVEQNKQSMEMLSHTVGNLRHEINTLIELKYGREKRIKALERRIRDNNKTPAQKLTERLESLEKRYISLKKSKKASKETLAGLKSKIKLLKSKIKGLSP